MGAAKSERIGAKSSFWKRFWSYLIEIHVESAPSDINPHLYVSLRNGRYQLSTAHAIYSYEDLYTNFHQAFQKINLPFNDSDVLILGFGLGSIPSILEHQFDKNYQYTAVELDESVLYLAHKYTLPQLKSSIQTICADAYAYIFQSTEKFHLICMDVFLDDVIPAHFQSIAYLEALKQLLVPNGILLYNCLAARASDKAASRHFFEHFFLKVFPNATFLEVDGNWMLLNEEGFLKNH